MTRFEKAQTPKASDAGPLAGPFPSRRVWYMSQRRIYKRTPGGVQPGVRGMGLGVPLNYAIFFESVSL